MLSEFLVIKVFLFCLMESRLYFNSNIQETTKRQVYPLDVNIFQPLHEQKSCQIVWLVIEASDEN